MAVERQKGVGEGVDEAVEVDVGVEMASPPVAAAAAAAAAAARVEAVGPIGYLLGHPRQARVGL